MYLIFFSIEQNGYSEDRTFIHFQVEEMTAMEVQKLLQEHYQLETTEVLQKIEAGEVISLHTEAGAANVRVSEKGWTIIVKDLSQAPKIALTYAGFPELTEIDGLDNTFDPYDQE